MKSHNIYRYGKEYYATPTGNPVYLAEALPGHFQTTAGVMVQGDGVKPNAWNYTISDKVMAHGDIQLLDANGNLSTRYFPEAGPSGADFEKMLPSSWDDAGNYNAALSRLNEKVRGSLDLSVSLAEMGKTAAMVRALKKLEGFVVRTPIKTLANKFLEYKYGWRPLMADAYGIADEILRKQLNGVHTYKAVSRIPVGIPAPAGMACYLADVYGYSAWANYKFPGALEQRGFHLTKVQVRLRASGFDLSRWTSLNPLSLGWELIPFSFVVDWVYDVGSYLRNFETGLLRRSDFVDGFYTHLRVFDSSWTFSDYARPLTGQAVFLVGTTPARRKYRYMRRTVLSSYPLPNFPILRFDLKSGNWLTLAALAAQRMSGKATNGGR